MKTHHCSLLILLFTLLLSSCTSVKNSSNPNDKTEQSPLPIDLIFIDYEPTLPDVEHHVFRAVKDDRSGWMNIKGDWIIPPKNDPEFKRGWFEEINICSRDGKYGAVNYKNEVIIPFEYIIPPSDCSHGLILVRDSLNHEAYFSKKGVQLNNFTERQPEFHNGFAVLKNNRKRLARYPRIDLESSNATSDIYTCDFVVINTRFDTLLKFEQVPFLIEFGSLNDNRRSFFLYPYMGKHADEGISYGQYGYLDGDGNVVIEPKFRASDVFIRIRGYTRNADCPFNSNLSMVREMDKYYYIDTLGNKVFDLQTEREKLFDASHFNNYGVASYRTSGSSPNSIMIHIIDRTGTILHESNESDAYMSYVSGNISSRPGNDLIPIRDYKNGVLRVNTPQLEPFASFPLSDSSKSTHYQYRGLIGNQLNDEFILKQFKKTKHSSGYPGSQQRLIDKNQIARSSWLPFNCILSTTYGNFSMVDSTKMTNKLYDFNKNTLFECDSCFFQYDSKISAQGVYKVQLSNGTWIYVNYQGKVLSTLFDSMEENIFDLSNQVKTFNENSHTITTSKEEEFEKLFMESIMYQRIIK